MTDNYPYRYEPASRPLPYFPPPPPPPTPPTRSGTRGLLVGLVAGFAAATLVVGGVALANGSGSSTVAGSGSVADLAPNFPNPGSSAPSGSGSGSGNGSGNGGSSAPATTSGTASATQQIGIVTIVSTLKYQNAQSAGTGLILSADGEILTNNHVINGATSVVVTVETTGKSYRADVVGTAPGKDVAVLQLKNASGLQTAKLADSADGVQVGDAVIGVGNAGGTGSLTAAGGKVTALGRSITASDETGQSSEKLSDLIEIDAKIIAGDSGGPLYDAHGDIIGVDTAASAKPSATSSAYAIEIQNAVGVAKEIETGVETTSIHIGYPGFLGITTGDASGSGGAAVSDLLDGGPAADAGITPGSIITAIDGKPVVSADGLRAILAAKDPGSKVVVEWTDGNGGKRSADVTLAAGPAD